jgi:hypothetical protein
MAGKHGTNPRRPGLFHGCRSVSKVNNEAITRDNGLFWEFLTELNGNLIYEAFDLRRLLLFCHFCR